MDATKLGEAVWTIHLDHMRVLDQIVEKSRTRGENGALLYLYHMGRPMYPGELTEKLCLTTGRIANILRVLEAEELIVRTPDALDKRRVRVALTPAGEVRAKQLNDAAVTFHASLMAQLTPEEAQQFLDMLKRMTDVVEREIEGCND